VLLLLQLARVQKRLDAKKITLEVTDKAVELLANIGYDPNYGARPVKRVIQSSVENELAKGILRGDFLEEDKIVVDTALTSVSENTLPQLKLSFTKVSPDEPAQPDADPPKYAASSVSA
jgi:ATP-dependent Clp protease ATP-binding subunit ClpB